jgi:hypothetical protein
VRGGATPQQAQPDQVDHHSRPLASTPQTARLLNRSVDRGLSDGNTARCNQLQREARHPASRTSSGVACGNEVPCTPARTHAHVLSLLYTPLPPPRPSLRTRRSVALGLKGYPPPGGTCRWRPPAQSSRSSSMPSSTSSTSSADAGGAIGTGSCGTATPMVLQMAPTISWSRYGARTIDRATIFSMSEYA